MRVRRGTDNNRYNGGLSFDKEARRWKIMCRDGTQLWYYRGLMAAHVGRLLRPDELVHHLNEDPSDDRIENLEIVTRAEHINMHRAQLKFEQRQAARRLAA
jgi:hypothetical protein